MRYGKSVYSELVKMLKLQDILTKINARFFLKQDVRPDILQKAVQDAIKLYPVFGFKFEKEGDEIYLADNDAPVSIYNTDKIIFPDGKRFNGYLFFVGYSGKMISVSVDHRLSDGIGVRRFFGKVLERYKELLDGNEEEVTGPAYDLSLMYQQLPVIEKKDYQLYTPLIYEGEALRLPEVKVEKTYQSFICRADENLFMEYVRKYETTAFSAITQIVNKGIFALYPEGNDFIRTVFIISIQKAWGMEQSFANAVDFGMIDISRTEVDNPQCLKRIKADVKGQSSEQTAMYHLTHLESIELNKLMEKSTYICSYLRLGNIDNTLIESHQSVPVYYGSLPKLDVRAGGGKIEFLVSGSSQCEMLYKAVKTGLKMTGFEILDEARQVFEIEDGILTVID